MSKSWMISNLLDDNWMEINSYDSDIPEGWFRVALRVGIRDNNGNGVYDYGDDHFDYHWRYQTNNVFGDWAEKPGQTASQLVLNSNGVDPAASVWNDFYNSNVVYFAIKDIRTINWP